MSTDRVLICTLGESPAVVTEALDKYFFDPKEGLPLHECLVVHTNSKPVLESVEKVFSAFEGGRRAGQRLADAAYPCRVPGLEKEASTLSIEFFNMGFPDLITPEHHEVLMGNLAFLIAQARQAGRIVDVCLAGGRKTESACAAIAAQFFGADRVIHVVPSRLTREELQAGKLHFQLDKFDLTSMPLLDLSPITYRILEARKEKIASPEDALRILSEFTKHIPALAAREVERVYQPRNSDTPVTFGPIETRHLGFAEALERAQAVVTSDDHVLITGETGVGKEVLAKTIHNSGPRKKEPFRYFMCGQYTETLFESELFGVERGAHSEARVERPGPLEDAKGGTIFFDEVDELKPSLQAKLLRLLQSREFERVGGRRTFRVHARFIFATNKNLDELVAAKLFREDLRNRMRVVPIEIPPLRERKTDIPALVHQIVERLRSEGRRTPAELPAEAIDLLSRPDWPGNVRDLENALKEWITLGAAKGFPLSVLRKSIEDRNRVRPSAAKDELDQVLHEILSGRRDYKSYRKDAPPDQLRRLITRAKSYYHEHVKQHQPLAEWTLDHFKVRDLDPDKSRAGKKRTP